MMSWCQNQERATFSPSKVWRKGESRLALPKDLPSEVDSGFNVIVSEAGCDVLSLQAADALRFLEHHRNDLIRLKSVPSIETIILDFCVFRKPEFVSRTYSFAAELIAAAGAIGIGIDLSEYESNVD